MNANLAREVVKNKATTSVGASATDQAVSDNFRETAGALSEALRIDIFTGVATAATGITAKHQHTNMPGLWTDAKTVSITSSSQQSATVNATTDQLSITTHGLSEDQPVVVAGSVIPGGLEAKKIYFVKVISANAIQLKSTNDGQVVDITSTGTSVTVTAVRMFSISYLPTVAGDQSHMPLRSLGRVVVTSGAGDSVDIVSIRVNQED